MYRLDIDKFFNLFNEPSVENSILEEEDTDPNHPHLQFSKVISAISSIITLNSIRESIEAVESNFNPELEYVLYCKVFQVLEDIDLSDLRIKDNPLNVSGEFEEEKKISLTHLLNYFLELEQYEKCAVIHNTQQAFE